MDLSCFFDDQYVFGTVCKDIEELFQRVVLGLVVSDVAESELVVDGHGVFIGTFIEDVSSQTPLSWCSWATLPVASRQVV